MKSICRLIVTRFGDVSFYRWLRRKQIEKMLEQQAVKERTRQLRLEAKRAKQSQRQLCNMSEVRSFRFTDYNWRYLLNTSFWSCYPQNFGYPFFLVSVLWWHSKLWKRYISFGDVDSEFIFFFLLTLEQNKFLLLPCWTVLYHATNWITNELYIPLLLNYFNVSKWKNTRKEHISIFSTYHH